MQVIGTPRARQTISPVRPEGDSPVSAVLEDEKAADVPVGLAVAVGGMIPATDTAVVNVVGADAGISVEVDTGIVVDPEGPPVVVDVTDPETDVEVEVSLIQNLSLDPKSCSSEI